MKRVFLTLILFFLVMISIANSSSIEVGVNEGIKGNISSIVYDNNSNIVKFSIEFYNTGSVGYKTRIKLEVSDGNTTIFNGWSQEKDFMPGERKSFDIYWYNNNSGKYFAKLKGYFGNEISEYDKFEFSINISISPEDVFEIKNFRTYDNYMIFDVVSEEDSSNVIIIPYNYPSGWIFEQKDMVNLTKGNPKLVVLNYYPTLWIPSNVSLAIVSDKGSYYTEKTLEMKKIEGLTGLFFYIIDTLRKAFFY